MDRRDTRSGPPSGPPLGPGAGLSCAEYRAEIPLVVGGDLETEVLDLALAHLAGCEPCAVETARAARARDVLLGGLATELASGLASGPAPGLWPSIRAELTLPGASVETERRGASQEVRGRLLPFPRALPGVAALAAAALLLLVVRPWQAEEPPLLDLDPLVGANPAVGPGALVRVAADPVFDDYGSGLVPVSNGRAFQEELESFATDAPLGLKVPLTARDLRELEAAAGLRVVPEGARLLIQRGPDTTLASFPTGSRSNGSGPAR